MVTASCTHACSMREEAQYFLDKHGRNYYSHSMFTLTVVILTAVRKAAWLAAAAAEGGTYSW